MNTVVKIQPKDVGSIPYQEASFDIWDKKYRLTSKDGAPVDKTMDDTYKRVARALADVEPEQSREQWYESFLWALRQGAIPAGRSRPAVPQAPVTLRERPGPRLARRGRMAAAAMGKRGRDWGRGEQAAHERTATAVAAGD